MLKSKKIKPTKIVDSDNEEENNQLNPIRQNPHVIMDDELKTREEYVRLYKHYKSEYGEKMFLLYEVGSFYEVYAIKKENQYYETNIEDFSRICSLAISANTTMVRGIPYVMTGFNSYMIDKYVATILAASYTAVVYSQYDAPSSTAMEEPTAKGKNKKEIPKKIRKLDAIYSPGTYVPYDVDQSHQMTNNVAVIWIDTIKPRKATTRDHVICGIASANIYTGQTNIFEYHTIYYPNPTTFDELERVLSVLNPSESVFITTLSKEEIENVIQYVHVKTNHIHILYDHTTSDQDKLQNQLVQNAKKQTYIKTILDATYSEEVYDTYKEFQENTYATQAFVYLLHFMKERNPDLTKKIKLPLFTKSGSHVLLANYTLRQLNLIDDGEHNGQYSSLNSLINKCTSPMGRRKTYEQITAPIYDEYWLNREYQVIQEVLDIHSENLPFIPSLRQNIGQIKDIEKICRQIILKRIYPSSIYSLYKSVQRIRQINISLFPYPKILTYLSSMGQYEPFIPESEQGSHIESVCINVLGFLERFFVIEKCKDANSITAIDHTMIQSGVNNTLDAYVKEYTENIHRFQMIHAYFNNIMRGSQDFSAENSHFVKIHETEKSGASLQITKTRSAKLKSILASLSPLGPRVLQITKDFAIPVDDITLVSPSKTIDEITCPQIVEILHKTNHLKVVICKEVEVIYKSLLSKIESDLYDQLDNLVEYITYLDVLLNKAYVAREYNYCRPYIRGEETPSFFEVRELRHPLIEHIQQNEIYVTNDLRLSLPLPISSHIEDNDSTEGAKEEERNRGILIYGTNAVGKTSFIRAVGLAVLMAQSGFYVPATEFNYKPYKSVFSRILGNDNLFKGLSTFAVEMSELRVILKYADQNSLILGDELCSGTEIESALSIFTSGLMTLYDKEATFLFATHFHEILEYDEVKEMVKNGVLGVKHMAVHYDRELDSLVYDRKLTNGPGNRLYGLEVCKSLYLEKEFLDNAYQIRNKYHPDSRTNLTGQKSKYNARKIRGQCEICQQTMGEEVHHLSPQKNANKDGFIGHFHKNHPANLANICEKCHHDIHREEKVSITIKKKTTSGYKIIS
jgi:DNA mismatch repair protein MutS